MLTFRAVREIWSDAFSLYVGERDFNGKIVARLEAPTMVKTEEHIPIDPAFRLNIHEAQGLMDELWGAGVRPTSGVGNVGQLGATEKHLEDMRRLVFQAATP